MAVVIGEVKVKVTKQKKGNNNFGNRGERGERFRGNYNEFRGG